MHEVSICQSIINTVANEMEEQLEQVREIHLKIGILSCVQPLFLEHVYGYMIVDGPLQHSRLQIERMEVLASCEVCNRRFKVENYRFVCPHCGQPTSHILEGNELKIVKIILEEPQHEKVNQ